MQIRTKLFQLLEGIWNEKQEYLAYAKLSILSVELLSSDYGATGGRIL